MEQDRSFIAWKDAHTEESDFGNDNDEFTNPFASDLITNQDPVAEFMESVPRSDSVSPSDPPEMYLPGLVIHIVPQPSNSICLCGKAGESKRRHNVTKLILQTEKASKI